MLRQFQGRNLMHIKQDKVSNSCNKNILRKILLTQGDWNRHHIGDPNRDKTLCVNYLLQLFVIVYSPTNLQVSRLSTTDSWLIEFKIHPHS